MTNNLITRIGVQINDIYGRLQVMEQSEKTGNDEIIKLLGDIIDPLNTEKVSYYDTDGASDTSGSVLLNYYYVSDDSSISSSFYTKSIDKSENGRLVDYILSSNNLVIFIFQRRIFVCDITDDTNEHTSTATWYQSTTTYINSSDEAAGTDTTTYIIGQQGFVNPSKRTILSYSVYSKLKKTTTNDSTTTTTTTTETITTERIDISKLSEKTIFTELT